MQKENLILLLAEKSQKPKEEIEKLIEEKKAQYAGLLTNEGAAYMVARDLNIDLELSELEHAKLKDLTEGMQKLQIEATIKEIRMPRTFKKENRIAERCSILLEDEGVVVPLVLWNKDIERFEKLKLERGDRIRISNCSVQKFNDALQLRLSYDGKIELLQKGKRLITEIANLKPNMQDINIIARVVRLFEEREFEREGQKGKVMRFLVADDSGKIMVVAWHDAVNAAKALTTGELIKIENAYTKESQNGLELHIGYKSRILKDPILEEEFPPLEKILGIKEAKLKELNENETAKISGVIVSANRLISFWVCPKCRKRAVPFDDTFICEFCGEVKAEKRIVLSFDIDDGSAIMQAVAFQQNAAKLLKMNLQELLQNENLDELKSRIIGNKVGLIVSAKKNSLSGNLELVVRDVLV